MCEEKSTSPRMAYGVEDLLARTRVNGSLEGEGLVRVLEAARQHVVTPRGAPHVGFEASLSPVTPTAWRFEATGVWDDAPADIYDVLVEDVDGMARAPDVAEAPRTIRDAAWRATNESGETIPTLARATWDPALPSCVTLQDAERAVVVNVVQGRVVALRET